MLFGRFLKFAKFQQLFDHAEHDAAAFVDMCHLATTENHRHLNLVLVFQKALCLLDLESNIVCTRFGPQSNFLGPGGVTVLIGFLFLVVLVFAVVHDPANRRLFIGSHFNQIEIIFFRFGQRFLCRNDSQLRTVRSDDTDRSYSDLFIDLGLNAVDIVTLSC